MHASNTYSPNTRESRIHQDQIKTHSQQELEAALSRKQKQYYAATLGHVDIPISPLEKQIQRLTTMLEGQNRKNANNDTREEIVVPLQTIYQGDKDAKTRTDREGVAGLQGAQALPNLEKDTEKILGTWI